MSRPEVSNGAERSETDEGRGNKKKLIDFSVWQGRRRSPNRVALKKKHFFLGLDEVKDFGV
jgi:hypothetical protein